MTQEQIRQIGERMIEVTKSRGEERIVRYEASREGEGAIYSIRFHRADGSSWASRWESSQVAAFLSGDDDLSSKLIQ